MFTGLIQEIGKIISARPAGTLANGAGAAMRFEIAASRNAPSLTPGESVAVDGCCLTVETRSEHSFTAFASQETLSRTTLESASKHPGKRVNLERALAVGDRLGGHWISGHVDGAGRVATIRAAGGGDGAHLFRFEVPEELTAHLITKGSIAIDGVSLTIARLDGPQVEVAIIPETFQRTTLGSKREGDAVNIETDMIGKYVFRYLETMNGASTSHGRAPSLTVDKLLAAGF